jgi:hypothetical protein
VRGREGKEGGGETKLWTHTAIMIYLNAFPAVSLTIQLLSLLWYNVSSVACVDVSVVYRAVDAWFEREVW